MKMKSMIIGISLSLLASPSFAKSDFSTIAGIPVEAMSQAQMDTIQGKSFFVPCVARSVCGSGGNVLTGNWNWTSGLFSDIRRNYPQIWYPSYPLSYPWASNYPWWLR
ncbi:MAG: hypothetical protein V3V22_07775 [Methylococcales bacterium]